MKETLQKNKILIDRYLCQHIDASTKIGQAILYGVRGGKFLRGSCALEVAGAYGVLHPLPLAAAIECVQGYSLVHDDLPAMDDAELRRGKPTCHKAFDEATALLAGDGLLTMAFEFLAHVGTEHLGNLTTHFARAIGYQGMILGQMMDLGLDDAENSFEGVCRIAFLKTGKFLGFSCAAAAIAAGASSQDQEILREFGEKFGILYQIRDDYLDRYGDVCLLGKTTGADTDKKTACAYLDQNALEEYLSHMNGELEVLLSKLSQPVSFLTTLLSYNAGRLS